MMIRPFLYIFTVLLFVFTACEDDFEVEVPNPEQKLVMEATIEAGSMPVAVITRSAGFYNSFNPDELARLIVSGADVTISDGSRTIPMQEITIDTVNGVELVVYMGLSMQGKEGKTYVIEANKDNDKLIAKATIPALVPLDSVFQEPYTENDSFVRVMGSITDPAGIDNYYRVATARNSSPLTYGVNSVVDDVLFNGESFVFPINRSFDDENDHLPYGVYRKGDTAIVKWCSISKSTYNFYSSVEYQRQNSGNPFTNIARIEGNVEGGLGIFAGNSCKEYTIIIPD